MKTVISIVLGTIILFAWNAISWMVLPFHGQTLNNIPDGAIQTTELKNLMPESGVYHYPGMPGSGNETEMAEVERKLSEGPRITMMVYKNEPTKLFEPTVFLYGLIINFFTALIAYWVIAKTNIRDTTKIILLCLGIGLISVLLSDISLMNWFMYPAKYTIVNAIDKVIALGLLGLLFAFYTFKSKKA